MNRRLSLKDSGPPVWGPGCRPGRTHGVCGIAFRTLRVAVALGTVCGWAVGGVAASLPSELVLAIERDDAGVRISWAGALSAIEFPDLGPVTPDYELQASEDLLSWQTVWNEPAGGAGERLSRVEVLVPTLGSAVFYRVIGRFDRVWARMAPVQRRLPPAPPLQDRSLLAATPEPGAAPAPVEFPPLPPQAGLRRPVTFTIQVNDGISVARHQVTLNPAMFLTPAGPAAPPGQ